MNTGVSPWQLRNLTSIASIAFLRCKARAELFRNSSIKTLFHLSNRHLSTSHEKDFEEEESLFSEGEEEENLHQLQDVSRLAPKFYHRYHNMVLEPPFKDLVRRRNMYMMYGSKSGEDPRLLWPSRQEIARFQQEDREEEVRLQEKIRLVQLEKEEEVKVKLDRHEMIEKNMTQMKKWINEYYKKIDAVEAEIQKRKDKKEALLDEARDYFGYRIKANDPKFQQMVEEKEEKERKEAKEKRKKEKAKKLAERLKQDVLAMKMTSGEENKKVKS